MKTQICSARLLLETSAPSVGSAHQRHRRRCRSQHTHARHILGTCGRSPVQTYNNMCAPLNAIRGADVAPSEPTSANWKAVERRLMYSPPPRGLPHCPGCQ
eukprot:gene14942-biopygen17142